MADETQKRPTTSPLVAAAQGASPMSAAMANTPASKQGKGIGSATSILVKGNNHLGTANVVPGSPKQVPSEAGIPIPGDVSDEERARQQSRYSPSEVIDPSLQMSIEGVKEDPVFAKLGGMGATIQNYVAKSITDLYSGQGDTEQNQLTVTDIAEAPLDLNTEEREQFNTLMKEIEAETDPAKRNKLIEKLAAIIGTPESDTGRVSITWDQVKSTIGDVDEVLGGIIAQGLSDTIKVDDKILTSLGYTTQAEIDQLEDLLQVEDLSKLSIKELQDKTQDYLEKRFAPVEKLRTVVSDPFASASERETALENLRDMGYTGTLASQESLDAVSEDIQGASKNIKFGGEVYETIDDLLSDDTVTNLVSDYLNNPDKPSELPPELTNIIDRNRDVFEDIMSELKAEVGHFNDVQKSWDDSFAGLSDDLKSLVGYNPKTVYTTKFVPPTTGLLSKVFDSKVPEADKQVYTNIANNVITQVGNTLATTIFNGLDNNELEQLKNPAISMAFSEGLRLGRVVDDIQADTNVKQDDKSMQGKANVMARLFGIKSDELIKVIENLEDMRDLGDTSVQGLLDAFDKFLQDDKSVGDLLNSFDVMLDAGDLGKVTNLNSIPGLLKSKIDEAKNVSGIYNSLAKYRRGEMDDATMEQTLSQMNFSDLVKLSQGFSKELTEKIKPILRNQLARKMNEEVAAIAEIPTFTTDLEVLLSKPADEVHPMVKGNVYKAIHAMADLDKTITGSAKGMVSKQQMLPLTTSIFKPNIPSNPGGKSYELSRSTGANSNFLTEFKAFFGSADKVPAEFRKLYRSDGSVPSQSELNSDLAADIGGLYVRYSDMAKAAGSTPTVFEFASLMSLHKSMDGAVYSPAAAGATMIQAGKPGSTAGSKGAGASTATQGGRMSGETETNFSGLGEMGVY